MIARRLLFATAVFSALILLASALPPSAAAVGGPVEIDLGDGTVVLIRDPGKAAELATMPRGQRISSLRGHLPRQAPPDPARLPSLLDMRLLEPRGVYRDLGIKPGSVIGEDDRRRVRKTNRYPASAVAFVLMDVGGGEFARCSGGLVGAANLLMTAAHCVFDNAGGGWLQDWTIYPGLKSTGQQPFGSCGWEKIFVHKKYQRGGDKAWEYDSAAIVLDCMVGNQTGWFGANQSSGSGFVNGTHMIYQYPADKPNQTQWLDSGPWESVFSNKRRVYYGIDTAGGSSGSMVLQEQSDGTYDSTGTHTHGVGSAGFNSATLWWKSVWKKVLLKGFNAATREPA